MPLEFPDGYEPVENLGAEPADGTDFAAIGADILGAAGFLQVEVNAAGLTGYQLEANTLSEMNRLRAYLFSRARKTITTGPFTVGEALQDWALVSDRYLLSAWPSLNLEGYRDVRAIFKGEGSGQVDCEVTKSDGEQLVAPGEATNYGSITVTGPEGMKLALASVVFHCNYLPSGSPPELSLVGDSSVFSATGRILSFDVRFQCNPLDGEIDAPMPFVIDYELKNESPVQLEVISRTVQFVFRKSIPEAEYDARVINRDGDEWHAMDIPKLEIEAGDATITQTFTLSGTDDFPYYTARMGPVGIIGYASYSSAAELWNRQQWSDAANFPGEGTPEIGATSRPRTLLTAEPLNSAIARSWQPPAALGQRMFPDSTRAAASWPDYQEISFTVPAELKPAEVFNFSSYRWNFEGALEVTNPDRCAYYEIPLEASPELEHFVAWNNNDGDRSTAKTHQTEEYSGQIHADGIRAAHGTQAFDYFHDQRIVSADGGKFWYRDAFTVLSSDLATKLRRFPSWTIERAADGAFTLKLLVPEHDIVVGYQIDGTPITQAATYWPSGSVSAEDYRGHYLEHGGLFVGTWPDFIPPFRFFNTAIDGPIAGWTVDKTIGGAWEPGQQLKLYLPRGTPRYPSTSFHVMRQSGLDANVAITQTFGLPAYAGPVAGGLVQNVRARQQRRRFATLVFRNRQCQLATDAMDLRLHIPNQQDLSVRPPLYGGDDELEDWRDLSFAPEPYLDGRSTLLTPGKELNMGDYYFDRDTNTIHLNRTDALPDDGDDFLLLTASFETDSTTECILHYGYLIDGAVPEEFVFFREDVADNNQGDFYFNSLPSGNSYSPKWILHDVWPICYQRKFQSVSVGVTEEDYTYRVPASDGFDHSIAGKLVRVTSPEDATLTHEIGWRAKIFVSYAQINERHDLYGSGLTVVGQILQSSETALQGTAARYQNQFWNETTGEQLTPVITGGLVSLVDGGLVEPAADAVIRIQNDRYATTETNVLQGAHYIHPRTARTTDADRYGRLFHFRLLSARQNWRVDVAWRQIYPDPVVQPEIIGIPLAAHMNETVRLLRAWVAAGKP